MPRARHARQLELPRHSGWGGTRAGAGRQPAGPRRRVSQAAWRRAGGLIGFDEVPRDASE